MEKGSRRNGPLSRSLAVSSTRTSNRSAALEMLNNSVSQTRNHGRGGSAIEIRDIIENSQKYSHKIGASFIPALQKPMSYTFQKNTGKDFVSAIQKSNSIKLGPNHYNIFDRDGFSSKDNPKAVKFAFNREAKTSVIE